EDVLDLRQDRDRSKVFDGIKRQFGAVKRRVGAVRPTRGCAERVSVRRGLRHHLHADVAATSRSIFYDEGLSPLLAELLSNGSCDRVNRTTRLKRNDDANRSRGRPRVLRNRAGSAAR